jgi:NADH dehydrogenase
MILVTGGAGVMGSRLVRRLLTDGRAVRALVLPGDPRAARLEGSGAEVVRGDVTDRASLQRPMDGVETVYHLAAVIVSRDPTAFRRVNTEGTRNVVGAAAAAGPRHLVYVSSASVTYPALTHYARSKMDAEEIVRAEGRLSHTIVRPTLVYDRRGGREIEMLAAHIRRFPVVPLIGSGRALKRPVVAGDVIEGLARIAGNERAPGKVYSLSGGESITVIDLARLIARQLGLGRVIVPTPSAFWTVPLAAATGSAALARQIVAGFTQDADLDNSEARRDLGYDPQPVSAGLPRYFHRRSAKDLATQHETQRKAARRRR